MDTCPECGKDYKQVTKHWRFSPGHRPDISDRQMELITGLYMGDGTLDDRDSRNHPSIIVRVSNEEFVEWVGQQLEPFATTRFVYSGEEVAERQKKDGTFKGTVEGYSDRYEVRVTSHPDLDRFRKWVGPEGKRFPEDLTLTPLIAKMWYCCDGHLDESGIARMGCYTEIEREEYLRSLFEEHGIEPSIYWNSIYLRRAGTEHFFDWIGEPIPGFGFKWP
jgi:hypothetical protein